jgi:hypothetical protein
MEDAFGVVAMVAMTPLVVIQLLGLIYRKQFAAEKARIPATRVTDEIITFERSYRYA